MPNKHGSEETTQTKILNVATKLFAGQGYQKTTIAEISRQAGYSEAAMYEYFQGKEDLLFTIPHLWVNRAIEEVNEQLFGIRGAFNKLRKFLWWYLRLIERDSLIAKVIYLILKSNADYAKTEGYQRVRFFLNILTDIFKEGIESGEMDPDMDPYVARTIFLGTIEHKVIRWILKNESYSLFKDLEQTFSILEKGFRKEPSPIRE